MLALFNVSFFFYHFMFPIPLQLFTRCLHSHSDMRCIYRDKGPPVLLTLPPYTTIETIYSCRIPDSAQIMTQHNIETIMAQRPTHTLYRAQIVILTAEPAH